MTIYALLPLIATLAYIPLVITTISSRPWQRRHTLFLFFLVPALLWSFTDFLVRGNFLPEHNFLLFRIILILFTWMAVQFHCFSSSFFAPGEGRWLPLACATLVMVGVMVALGYFPKGVAASGDKLYPEYGRSVLFMFAPLMTVVIRNLHLFFRRLKVLNNPILYNQIVSLIIGILFLTVFTLAALLPWGREFPISHFGNLANAFILSYATIRHELVDIRFILRRALAYFSIVLIGGTVYGLSFFGLHLAFGFQLDLTVILAATAAAVLIGTLIYRLRTFLFITLSKAFLGEKYDYRQELSSFANKIHDLFSFTEQGSELLVLVTKAIGCRKACLLFPETGDHDFTAQLVEPKGANNPLSGLRLTGHNPIVEYLSRERRPLTREDLAIMTEFRSLWGQEKEEIKEHGLELFLPLISRGRLIGILVLDKKQSGKYSLEDFNLLEEVTNRVAVSIEKEYLREQLGTREKELSVINRSSSIITSSLDIQRSYEGFIQELKKVVDVSWAAIVLIEENGLYFLAISSEMGSAWHVGERIPITGTATEWVAAHKKTMVEPDLAQEARFATGKYYLQQGIRSVVYLPLAVKGEVIGSLIVASCKPNAYSRRDITLLEELASQVAMPVENSRLYAKAEEKARVDGLTGLLNRRSLDEMLVSEISRHSRYGGVFSVIILDLDSFKVFNDNHGHLAGDRLLRQIGSLLKRAIRSADQAFRYGGDEFAILLPQTNADDALQVAERVRELLSEAEASYVPVSTSIGLASWPADGLGPQQVVAAADAALYHAKRSGGNQCQRYVPILLPSDVTSAQSSEDSEALSTIYALAATVDTRDHYTRSHSKRVNEYATAIAEALGMGPLEISRLSTCALLHDIGKIGISDEILNKPDRPTAEEWEVIKLHPQLGAAIISHARHLAPCVLGILHHHERYDGSGYTHGLKGEEIPLEARILAIADAFAAMTSERPYSKALSYEQGLEEIRHGSGTQFDPNLVEVLLRITKTSPSSGMGTKGGETRDSLSAAHEP